MNRDAIRRRRWTAVLAGAAVPLILLAGMLMPATIDETAAEWTDRTAVTATVEAAVVPAPTLTRQCQFRPGLLGIGARVRIFWELPEGYTLDDVVVEASTSGLGSVLAPLTGFSLRGNTDLQSDGTYQTDVPTHLLGGLLGLGTELEIAISVEHPEASSWTSEHASVASNAGLIGGIGGNCRNLT